MVFEKSGKGGRRFFCRNIMNLSAVTLSKTQAGANNEKKQRDAGPELLCIFAMLLIIRKNLIEKPLFKSSLYRKAEALFKKLIDKTLKKVGI